MVKNLKNYGQELSVFVDTGFATGDSMKLIIAGSRDWRLTKEHIDFLIKLLNLNVGEIVCGAATGIDMSGYHYGNSMLLPVKMFKPDWKKWGKSAGHIRNRLMAEYGDQLLLIWDGESRGSASMKREMLKVNKPIHEVIFTQHKINYIIDNPDGLRENLFKLKSIVPSLFNVPSSPLEALNV